MQTGNAYVLVYTTVTVRVRLFDLFKQEVHWQYLRHGLEVDSICVHVCEQHVVSCKMCIRVLTAVQNYSLVILLDRNRCGYICLTNLPGSRFNLPERLPERLPASIIHVLFE